MVKKWKTVTSKHLQNYRIFDIRQDTNLSPRTGKEHNFFIIDSPNWINIIALTPEENVVLIHQYRHGTGEICIEIPGGIVDPGEDALTAAMREFREETGYEAEEWRHIGHVDPNPAFLNNRTDTFLALNAKKVEEPQFDGSEDIAVEEVPISTIPSLITSGKITHAIVVAAFYHYEQFKKGN